MLVQGLLSSLVDGVEELGAKQVGAPVLGFLLQDKLVNLVMLGVDVPTTGLEATTNVGSVTVTGGTGIDANVTGLEATTNVGSITMTGDANVNVTGIAPGGQVGTVTAKGIALINLTGVSATGQVTEPAVEGDASVSVTGVGTSGEVGSVLVWDRIDPDATVVWTEIAA